MLNASQRQRNCVPLSHDSGESAPALNIGLLARIPTVRPPIRASVVISERPKRGFSSSSLPSSTIRASTRCMS